MELTEEEEAQIDPSDKKMNLTRFWTNTMKKLKSEIDEVDFDDFEDP